jgi:hypothetical protein
MCVEQVNIDRSAAGTRGCPACRPLPGAWAGECAKAANFAEGCHPAQVHSRPCGRPEIDRLQREWLSLYGVERMRFNALRDGGDHQRRDDKGISREQAATERAARAGQSNHVLITAAAAAA